MKSTALSSVHYQATNKLEQTWPGALESHTDVAYCLSNSGALSFWSSVSMATTALDTRFGLSERETEKDINPNVQIIAENPPFVLHWVKYKLEKRRCSKPPRAERSVIPLCVAMTEILCHCSSSRSNSITALIKPKSEVMRNKASGSDWGSMEYLRYGTRHYQEFLA